MESETSPVVDFHQLFDSIPGSVSVMNAAGNVEFVNRAGREYRGATIDQLRPWKTSGSIHPDDVPAAAAMWERCLRTGEPFDREHRIRRFDGVYRWFRVRGMPVKTADGEIVRWCFLDEDIDDIRASEARLRTIVDAGPGFVWSAGPDGSVEFLNQRWYEYTGMSQEEARGYGWASALHPGDSECLMRYWSDLMQSSQAGQYEARLRRCDGVYRWFLIKAVPQLDEAGHVVRWYGANTDIDDRKQAELVLAGEKHVLGMMAGGLPLHQVLRRLCDLVEAALEDCTCSVALVDPRPIRSSSGAAPVSHFQPGVAPRLPPGLFEGGEGGVINADAGPASACALSGRQVVSAHLALETRWESWRTQALALGYRASVSTPILSAQGTPIGVLSAIFRRTHEPTPEEFALIARFTHLASIAIERAFGEAALKQSQAFMTRAQQLSLTGTFSWRVDSDAIVWSDEVYRILELDPSVTPTFDLIYTRIHPDDVAGHHEMIRQQRADPSDFEHEHRLLLPSGRVKYVYLVAHATRDDAGGLEYIAALQDITQRRSSEATLNKIRSELAHMARVFTLGALTASIAHEVNQPLSGIITNANTCLRMLASDPPNIDGALETARRTIRDGNRASDVIKRLRALFSKKTLASDSIDLNEAAREVIALLLGEMHRNGVAIQQDFASDLPLVIGDRVQLQQVILNLILNASDALLAVTDRARQIRIVTWHEGGCVHLAVQDNGIGFPQEDATRLFDAFYTTKDSGMGIGLSVSQSIIESLKGSLLASANEGPGAKFSFFIPCA